MKAKNKREAFEGLGHIKRLLGYSKFNEQTNRYELVRHESFAIRDTCELNTAWETWQAVNAVPEWISVEDRMPEQGQKVLVFRPDAHNHPYKDPNFKICTYAGANIFINSHFEHTITHWKPITAPVEVQEPAND